LHHALSEKGVALHVSSAARSNLARRGYDPLFGARPLARLIESELNDEIASEILFGRLQKGGSVHVGSSSDKLTFRFKL
jgi:ATP-dependent Clp protease ATP-binding subunit ClpA